MRSLRGRVTHRRKKNAARTGAARETDLPVSSVGSEGLEPSANGLKARTTDQAASGSVGDLGTRWGQLERQAALRLLELAARSEPVPAELFDVLGMDADAPHALRQAIAEARRIVLSSSGEPEQQVREG